MTGRAPNGSTSPGDRRGARPVTPTPATLADYDFDPQPAVDRALIGELGTCRYLETVTNVLLIGPPGVGKTHLAVGLARQAAEVGYRT